MLFNSLTFFLFFVVVFLLYLALPQRGQNRLLLAASYFFYAAWDWRFLLMLAFTTTVDYCAARGVCSAGSVAVRKRWLAASVIVNLGILGFFKYFNFFADSLTGLLQGVGVDVPPMVLRVILPMGISFYTFQCMSYTIDVYRGVLVPTRSWIDFALYVSFFPQLVAGPIERATNLLPQVQGPRTVSDYGITHGAYLILWGLFQKVVVADNLARLADTVFARPPGEAVTVLMGVYAFALQIYCDFAGYSNMARGLAMMMGFRLMLNFRNPYFATNPSEFWQRWHISLSTWLRDYLYIPLGGNRRGPGRVRFNLMLTMLLGGLWHGAAWTFVAWGAFHGTLLILYRCFEQSGPVSPRPASPVAARLRRGLAMFGFFHLICLSWLLFRAESITQAGEMLATLATGWGTAPATLELVRMATMLGLYGLPLVAMEVWQHRTGDPLVVMKAPRAVRAVLYLAMVYGIILFGNTDAQSFIYFQF